MKDHIPKGYNGIEKEFTLNDRIPIFLSFLLAGSIIFFTSKYGDPLCCIKIAFLDPRGVLGGSGGGAEPALGKKENGRYDRSQVNDAAPRSECTTNNVP